MENALSFFKFLVSVCEKSHAGNPLSSKIVLIIVVWPYVQKKKKKNIYIYIYIDILLSDSGRCPLATYMYFIP